MKAYLANRLRRLLPRVVGRIIILILSMPYGQGQTDSTIQANSGLHFFGPKPSIQIKVVSQNASTTAISGRVSHVDVSSHYVAVYVCRSSEGWSIRPSIAEPRTFIRRDSTWRCRSGVARDAGSVIAIRAYVLPDTFSPPLVVGIAVLPSSLDSAAIAWTEDRHPQKGSS